MSQPKEVVWEQPQPVPNGHKATWLLVIKDMEDRNNLGVSKYGTPLQPFNGRNSLQDAYEEVLDLAVYLRNAIEEQNKNKAAPIREAYDMYPSMEYYDEG